MIQNIVIVLIPTILAILGAIASNEFRTFVMNHPFISLGTVVLVCVTFFLSPYFRTEKNKEELTSESTISETITDNPITKNIDENKDALSTGDIIKFGEYDWRVLDIQNDRALLITNDAISSMSYNEEDKSVIWEMSSIRKWLNGDFYNTFSEQDKARIALVTNINERNQWYAIIEDSDGNKITHDNNTQDKVFLLSISEVVKYFGDSGQLSNQPEDIVNISDQFNSERIAYYNGEPVFWWLRSPGEYSNYAACIDEYGTLRMYGKHVFDDYGAVPFLYTDKEGVKLAPIGVRPAIWLMLK